MEREHAKSSFAAFLAELARAPDALVQTEHLPATLPSATVIEGRYRVERLVGHGGMGEVYRAFDESLGRPVALKTAKTRLGRTAERRWRAEARALARLSHPNVVQVFRVGVEAGVPFIVMEWVPGRTLAQWAAETPRRWRDILEAYRQAAAGLAAAHALGIVHRDFKPHNVLLGEDGRVRVADFGLAVAAADDGPTQHGSGKTTDSRDTAGPAGTRAYMAPEALLGRPADARSDQFSFCVALHEALCGRLPLLGVEEPVAGVPAWLSRVVTRGLALDPARRHRDLDSLARALDPERRAARRRRRFAAYTGIAAIASALALNLESGSTPTCEAGAAALQRAWNPGRRDALMHAMTNTGSSMAVRVTTEVVDALDTKALEWTELRRSACEGGRASSGELACLERARIRFEATLDVLAKPDREVVARAEELVDSIGSPSDCSDAMVGPEGDLLSEDERQLRRGLAEVDALRVSGRVREARDRADEVLSLASGHRSDPLMAEALLTRGLAHAAAGTRGDGVEDLQAAYWIAEARHLYTMAAEASRYIVLNVVTGPSTWDEAERWSKIAEGAERRIGVDAPSWQLLSARATAAYAAQQFASARRDSQTALLAARKAAPAKRIVILNNHTGLLLTEHRLEDAVDLAREAVSLAEQHLPHDYPAHATALRNLGVALQRSGDRERAIEALRASLEIRRRIFDPTSTSVAESLGFLVEALIRSGRFEEALELARESVDLAFARQPTDWTEVAEELVSLGAVLFELGRFVDARPVLERAAATHERTGGKRTMGRAIALMVLGNTLLELGDLQAAVEAHTGAVDILRELLGPKSPQIAGALANRATALLLLQRAEEALVDLDAATEILVDAREERGLLGAMVLAMRADALAQLGQHESAAELALEALAIDQTLNPEPGPGLVRAHSTAADTLLLVGKLDEGERVVREGLVVLDQIEPMDHLRGKLALDLAKIALARGDRAELRRRCAGAVDAVVDASARAEIAAWCENNLSPRSERE